MHKCKMYAYYVIKIISIIYKYYFNKNECVRTHLTVKEESYTLFLKTKSIKCFQRHQNIRKLNSK